VSVYKIAKRVQDLEYRLAHCLRMAFEAQEFGGWWYAEAERLRSRLAKLGRENTNPAQ